MPSRSNQYAVLAAQIAQKYGIPAPLFVSLVRAESGFNPGAVSPAGAIGLGQLLPGTARTLGVNPFDPLQNLDGSARYFKQQLDRFGNVPEALAAYNAGPGAVQRYGGVPPYAETRAYVDRVQQLAGQYPGNTGLAGLTPLPPAAPTALLPAGPPSVFAPPGANAAQAASLLPDPLRDILPEGASEYLGYLIQGDRGPGRPIAVPPIPGVPGLGPVPGVQPLPGIPRIPGTGDSGRTGIPPIVLSPQLQLAFDPDQLGYFDRLDEVRAEIAANPPDLSLPSDDSGKLPAWQATLLRAQRGAIDYLKNLFDEEP